LVGVVVIAWIYLPDSNATRMLTVLKIAAGWIPAIFAVAVVLASVGPTWVVVRLHLKLRPFGLGAWAFLALPIEERKRLAAELGLQEK